MLPENKPEFVPRIIRRKKTRVKKPGIFVPIAERCWQSAEEGDAKAQFELAQCYETGSGIEKDKKTAFLWYQESAEQGYLPAQLRLAECYSYGIGIYGNPTKAAHWYMKAAEQGDPDAQAEIGKRYRYGYGVPQDLEKAVFWFKKAIENGSKKAEIALKKLEETLESAAAPPNTGKKEVKGKDNSDAVNPERKEKTKQQRWRTPRHKPSKSTLPGFGE